MEDKWVHTFPEGKVIIMIIIIIIGQNTEKSPEDLKRLVVPETPVRNHQLMLVWKTLKSIK